MAEREITVSLKLDSKDFQQGANVVEEELMTINEQLVKMEDELRNVTKEMGQDIAKQSFEELNATVEKNKRKAIRKYRTGLQVDLVFPAYKENLRQKPVECRAFLRRIDASCPI